MKKILAVGLCLTYLCNVSNTKATGSIFGTEESFTVTSSASVKAAPINPLTLSDFSSDSSTVNQQGTLASTEMDISDRTGTQPLPLDPSMNNRFPDLYTHYDQTYTSFTFGITTDEKYPASQPADSQGPEIVEKTIYRKVIDRSKSPSHSHEEGATPTLARKTKKPKVSKELAAGEDEDQKPFIPTKRSLKNRHAPVTYQATALTEPVVLPPMLVEEASDTTVYEIPEDEKTRQRNPDSPVFLKRSPNLQNMTKVEEEISKATPPKRPSLKRDRLKEVLPRVVNRLKSPDKPKKKK